MITIPGRSYAILSYLIERSIRAVHSIVRCTACITRDIRPNITGTFYAVNDATTGAFTHEGNVNLISDGARWGGKTKVTCDASLCNTSYASAETIQPEASYALMIIKE